MTDWRRNFEDLALGKLVSDQNEIKEDLRRLRELAEEEHLKELEKEYEEEERKRVEEEKKRLELNKARVSKAITAIWAEREEELDRLGTKALQLTREIMRNQREGKAGESIVGLENQLTQIEKEIEVVKNWETDTLSAKLSSLASLCEETGLIPSDEYKDLRDVVYKKIEQIKAEKNNRAYLESIKAESTRQKREKEIRKFVVAKYLFLGLGLIGFYDLLTNMSVISDLVWAALWSAVNGVFWTVFYWRPREGKQPNIVNAVTSILVVFFMLRLLYHLNFAIVGEKGVLYYLVGFLALLMGAPLLAGGIVDDSEQSGRWVFNYNDIRSWVALNWKMVVLFIGFSSSFIMMEFNFQHISSLIYGGLAFICLVVMGCLTIERP